MGKSSQEKRLRRLQRKAKSGQGRRQEQGPGGVVPRRARGAQPQGPRFAIRVDVDASGQASWNIGTAAENVTVGEVGIALVNVAARLFVAPGQLVQTPVQIAAANRRAVAARDYPAGHLHVGAGLYVCTACKDALESCLDDTWVDLPPLPPGSPPIPCDCHADPAKLPAGVDFDYARGVFEVMGVLDQFAREKAALEDAVPPLAEVPPGDTGEAAGATGEE